MLQLHVVVFLQSLPSMSDIGDAVSCVCLLQETAASAITAQ